MAVVRVARGTHQEVPVASVLLNPLNFRHDPAESQEEAIALLFEDDLKRAEMLALAADIAQRGLDPSSLPILEPEGKKWRVLEGNRRFAAMKVMSNPDVLPSLEGLNERQMAAYRTKWVKVGGAAHLPRSVLAFVTDDREFANHLIALKHTGKEAHKGAGTILWDTVGRTRYEQSLSPEGAPPRASNTQTAAALALIEALETHFSGDPELIDLLATARKRGLTTIGRLLIRPENQLRIGVQVDGGAVRFSAEREALRSAMLRILSDLGTKRLNSRSTNKASEVVDYLDSIDSNLPTPRDYLADAEPASAPDGTTPPKKKPNRRRRDPIMRKPFPGLELYHASFKTRSFLAELKSLSIDDYPFMIAPAIRTLIDLYTHDVMSALGRTVVDSPSQRAKQCLLLVEPASTKPRDRKFPRIADQLAAQTGDLSIDTMNGFMHRPQYTPTQNAIRAQVAEYQPWLQALDEYVEEQLSP